MKAIEQKAYDGNYKVYTELINRLEDVKNAIKKQNYGIAMDILCKLYPEHQITTSTELKESEDEKTKESLMQYIWDMYHKDFYPPQPSIECCDKWLDWLEKQGKQKIDDDDKAILENWEGIVKDNKEKWQLSDWFVEATLSLVQKIKQIGLPKSFVHNNKTMLNACINTLRNVGHSHLATWLEKQGHTDSIIEKAKTEKQRVIITETNGNANIDWDTRSLEDARRLLECGLQYINIELGKQGAQETLCDKCRKEHPSHFCQDITALGRCAVEHEQKPSDKVEPKFNVGDFVVDNCGYVWKIKEILNQCYLLEGVEGGESRPAIEWVNKTFHRWTIKDAKGGDILFEDLMGGKTFVYNGINTDMAILYSFIISNDGEDVLPYHIGKPNTGIGYIEENKNIVHPATQEQRDLLFSKMKEAGYEWDAEKKELKKIEQNPENYKKHLMNEMADLIIDSIKKKYDDEEMVEALRTEYEKGRADAIAEFQKEWSEEDELHIRELESLVKQAWTIAELKIDKDTIHKMSDLSFFLKTLKPQLKQEWSEDDESILQGIWDEILDNKHNAKEYEWKTYDKFLDWLQSLKYRVQPKVELTQVDKVILEAAIAFVEHNNHFNCWRGVDKRTVLSALHSLRPQNQWKPSDEQMKALANALSLAKNCGEESTFDLRTLYEQLKKL